MSATTASPAASPGPDLLSAKVGAASQLGRVMSSELTKLRTVRSTMWALVSTFLVSVGLPSLFAIAVVNSPRDQIGPDFDAAGFSMFGLFLGQLIVGTLG